MYHVGLWDVKNVIVEHVVTHVDVFEQKNFSSQAYTYHIAYDPSICKTVVDNSVNVLIIVVTHEKMRVMNWRSGMASKRSRRKIQKQPASERKKKSPHICHNSCASFQADRKGQQQQQKKKHEKR